VLELPPAYAGGSEKVYVIECKYSRQETGKDTEALLEEALDRGFAQIADRGYCERYIGCGKEVYKTAVAVAGRDDVRVRYERMA